MSSKNKKSSIVDKIVSKRKKNRELCLDLNTGKGMYVNKDIDTSNDIVDNVLKIKKVKQIKKVEPKSVKENAFYNLDNINIIKNETSTTTKIDFSENKPNLNKKIDNFESGSNVETGNNKNIIKIDKDNNIKQLNKTDFKPEIKKIDNVESVIYKNKNNNFIKKIEKHEVVSVPKKIIEPSNIVNFKKEPKKPKSPFSNSHIVNTSKEKYSRLLEKQNELERQINFKKKQMTKLDKQRDELEYLKKIDDENKKLINLEKKLKKIEKLKYLQQKKLSVEKYKKELEHLNFKKSLKEKELSEFNIKSKKAETKMVRPNMILMDSITQNNNTSKTLNLKKQKSKISLNSNHSSPLYNKLLNNLAKNDIKYNQIIKKYNTNIIPIKNIYANNEELKILYQLRNIDILINILSTRQSYFTEKIWHSLYNIKSFNFYFS